MNSRPQINRNCYLQPIYFCIVKHYWIKLDIQLEKKCRAGLNLIHFDFILTSLKRFDFPIDETHTQVGKVRLADPGDFIVAGIEMSGFFGEGRNTLQLKVITVHRSDQTGAQHTGSHTLPPAFRRQTQTHIKTQKLYWCTCQQQPVWIHRAKSFCTFVSVIKRLESHNVWQSHMNMCCKQYAGILLPKGHLSADISSILKHTWTNQGLQDH